MFSIVLFNQNKHSARPPPKNADRNVPLRELSLADFVCALRLKFTSNFFCVVAKQRCSTLFIAGQILLMMPLHAYENLDPGDHVMNKITYQLHQHFKETQAFARHRIWRHLLMVRKPDFQSGNKGSIPVDAANFHSAV